MKKIIITSIVIQNVRVHLFCQMEGTRLIEVHLFRRENDRKQIGSIFIGKIINVKKDLNAAFVNIDPDTSCYYPFQENTNPVIVKQTAKDHLSAGDEILVQIEKEGTKMKPPTVSSNITLHGRYLIVTSGNPVLGISKKLEADDRERLKSDLLPYKDPGTGVIVRTNAAHADEAQLLAELSDLTERLRHILEFAPKRTCYSCLYTAPPAYIGYLKNAYSSEVSEIVTDDEQIYQDIKEICESYGDLSVLPVRYYSDASWPLSGMYNLNREFMRAMDRKIWLKSGGFLILEPTEALTVIDVNSGKKNSGKNRQKMYLEINMEAAEEIALQLRLRNISGIIIIDFINMENPHSREKLIDHLKTCIKRDPIPVRYHDMTKLNLVELTRKRTEKTLEEHFFEQTGTRYVRQ